MLVTPQMVQSMILVVSLPELGGPFSVAAVYRGGLGSAGRSHGIA